MYLLTSVNLKIPALRVLVKAKMILHKDWRLVRAGVMTVAREGGGDTKILTDSQEVGK